MFPEIPATGFSYIAGRAWISIGTKTFVQRGKFMMNKVVIITNSNRRSYKDIPGRWAARWLVVTHSLYFYIPVWRQTPQLPVFHMGYNSIKIVFQSHSLYYLNLRNPLMCIANFAFTHKPIAWWGPRLSEIEFDVYDCHWSLVRAKCQSNYVLLLLVIRGDDRKLLEYAIPVLVNVKK